MGKSKIASRTRRKKPGAQIVRAWFDTVINPLLRSLEIERSHLARKDWTWQFRSGRFEVLEPINRLMDVVPDNLEQFLEFHPEVKKAEVRHDEELASLLEDCSGLQRELEESSELAGVYEQVTSPRSLSPLRPSLFGMSDQSDEALIRSFFGAYPKADHLALLAQLIINHTQELPSYHATASLWNMYGDDFLGILNHPPLVESEEKVEKAGHGLLQTVRRLTDLLKNARQRLSLEHDVPPVATVVQDARYF